MAFLIPRLKHVYPLQVKTSRAGATIDLELWEGTIILVTYYGQPI